MFYLNHNLIQSVIIHRNVFHKWTVTFAPFNLCDQVFVTNITMPQITEFIEILAEYVTQVGRFPVPIGTENSVHYFHDIAMKYTSK